ncbi:MAG: TrkA C-terminal domain-containing protein [Thermodesulfobacteriota bacterium]
MQEVIEFLRHNEVVLLFLVMALGYLLGRIKIGWFSLGTIAGSLIVGLVVGLAKFEISPIIKSVGFGVFIYAVGLRVGPQFFAGMKKDGLKLVTMSLVACLAGFAMVWAASAWLRLPLGIAPGILAGAMTNTPTLGAAEQAITSGAVALPSGLTAEMAMSSVAVAYAITYLFGTVGRIVLFKMLPRMFGYDLAAEAKKLEASMSGASAEDDPYSDYFSEFAAQGVRGYRLTNQQLAGHPLKKLQGHLPDHLVIERVERGGQVLELKDDLTLQAGDLVAVSGHTSDLIHGPEVIGPEVLDKALLDITGEFIEVLVTNKQAVGKTLAQVGRAAGFGCYLKRLLRAGVEQHVTGGMRLMKGDLLFITGAKTHVDRLANYLGYAVHRSAVTDLFTLAVGMVLGSLLGAVSVKLFGVPVSLGSAGGLLLAGIVISFLRSRHPTFGNIPGGARAVLEDIGLTIFIVVVGLTAGSSVVEVLKTSGPGVFLVGVAVTLVTALAPWLWGQYVLRLNPVINIGACTGAGVITAALKAVSEEAGSSLPALGYPVPYAVSTIVLTVMGYLILQLV